MTCVFKPFSHPTGPSLNCWLRNCWLRRRVSLIAPCQTRCSQFIQDPFPPLPPLCEFVLPSHGAVLHRYIITLHLGAGRSCSRLRFAAQTVFLHVAWPVADPQYSRTCSPTSCCANSTTQSLRCSFHTDLSTGCLNPHCREIDICLVLALARDQAVGQGNRIQEPERRKRFHAPVLCLPTFDFR